MVYSLGGIEVKPNQIRAHTNDKGSVPEHYEVCIDYSAMQKSEERLVNARAGAQEPLEKVVNGIEQLKDPNTDKAAVLATLEAAANEIIEFPGLKIQMAGVGIRDAVKTLKEGKAENTDQAMQALETATADGIKSLQAHNYAEEARRIATNTMEWLRQEGFKNGTAEIEKPGVIKLSYPIEGQPDLETFKQAVDHAGSYHAGLPKEADKLADAVFEKRRIHNPDAQAPQQASVADILAVIEALGHTQQHDGNGYSGNGNGHGNGHGFADRLPRPSETHAGQHNGQGVAASHQR